MTPSLDSNTSDSNCLHLLGAYYVPDTAEGALHALSEFVPIMTH